MGQAKARQVEIQALKSAGANGKNSAIKFKFQMHEHEYTLLSVYTPKIIKEMETVDYDNEKCLDIIMECMPNLLAVQNGAEAESAEKRKAVESCMRSVALAVLQHVLLDPYRSPLLQPDCVMDMTLETDADDNIGYNIAGQGKQLVLVQRGIQAHIDSAPADGVDAVLILN